MQRKCALVVDDSRSARTILRKMLEKHGIAVDTAVSAEEALDYLLHRKPDVIFMDHMMPGMDGFEAVRAIKGNPATATIPIMMYTSKEGEVYLGEARALGALGVLPKEVKPSDLLKALENLHLLPSGAPPAEPPPQPVKIPAAAVEEPSETAADTRIAALARDAAEDAMQRFIAGMFESLREKLREDLREELSDRSRLHASQQESDTPSAPRRRRWPAVAALLVVPIVAVSSWYWASRPDPSLSTAVAGAEAVATGAPTAMALQNTASIDRGLVERLRGERDKKRLLSTLEWALNQSGEYGFDQVPFGDDRLATLIELLNRLAAINFEGTVRLDAYAGRFCLEHDDSGELQLASPDLPVSRCVFLAPDAEQTRADASRQSVGFANFLSSSPLLREQNIKVELFAHGESAPRQEYPSMAAGVSAGQWNAVSRRNHRVEVSIIPAPFGSGR